MINGHEALEENGTSEMS